jgi:hypothetical protein
MRSLLAALVLLVSQTVFAVPITYGFGGSITGNCAANGVIVAGCTLPVGGYLTIDNTPLPGATDPGTAEYRTDGPNEGMSIFSVGGFHDVWDVDVRVRNDVNTVFGESTDMVDFRASGPLGTTYFTLLNSVSNPINSNALDLPSIFTNFGGQCFGLDACGLGLFRVPDTSLGFDQFYTIPGSDTTLDWRFFQLPNVIPVLRVPEPSTLSLAAIALIAIAFTRRRTLLKQ